MEGGRREVERPAAPDGRSRPVRTAMSLSAIELLAPAGLSLLSQSGSSGAAPSWSLVFDPDPTTEPSPAKLGCLGAYSAKLWNGGVVTNGIANATADALAGPGGSWVISPVTFVLHV